jgi:hypothetical protein
MLPPLSSRRLFARTRVGLLLLPAVVVACSSADEPAEVEPLSCLNATRYVSTETMDIVGYTYSCYDLRKDHPPAVCEPASYRETESVAGQTCAELGYDVVCAQASFGLRDCTGSAEPGDRIAGFPEGVEFGPPSSGSGGTAGTGGASGGTTGGSGASGGTTGGSGASGGTTGGSGASCNDCTLVSGFDTAGNDEDFHAACPVDPDIYGVYESMNTDACQPLDVCRFRLDAGGVGIQGSDNAAWGEQAIRWWPVGTDTCGAMPVQNPQTGAMDAVTIYFQFVTPPASGELDRENHYLRWYKDQSGTHLTGYSGVLTK